MASAVLRFALGLLAVPISDNDSIPAKSYRLGPLENYQVLRSDFDAIEQEANAVGTDLQFATLWLAIGVPCLASLLAVPLLSSRAYATYLVFTGLGFGLGVYFLYKWHVQGSKLKKLMARIRDSQVALPASKEERSIPETRSAADPNPPSFAEAPIDEQGE